MLIPSSRLEPLSHVVFIIACIALTTLAVARFRTPENVVQAARGAQDDPLPVGTHLRDWEGVSFEEADRTIVLVLRSTCIFCTESMPFYRELSARRNSKKLRIVALSPEPVKVLNDYLQKHSFAVDFAGPHSGAEIATRATPTLVLVARGGRVEKSWLGKLNEQQVSDLLGRLRS
jgi:peroxiredoxin